MTRLFALARQRVAVPAPSHPVLLSLEAALTGAARILAGVAAFVAIGLTIGVNPMVLGFLAALPFGSRFAQPIAPGLIERIGLRLTILLAGFVQVLALGVLAAVLDGPRAKAIAYLLSACTMVAMAQAIYDVAITKSATVSVPSAFAARSLALRQRWNGVAGLLAGLAGGAGATPAMLGRFGTMGTWSVIILAGALLIVFATLGGVLIATRAQDAAEHVARTRPPRRSLESLGMPHRSELYVLAILQGLGLGLIARQQDLFAVLTLHFVPADLVAFSGLAVGASALLSPYWGRWFESQRGALALALAGWAVALNLGCYLLAIWYGRWWIFLAALFWGAAAFAWGVGVSAWLLRTSAGAIGVSLYAAYNAAYGSAAVVGSLLGGWLTVQLRLTADLTAFEWLFAFVIGVRVLGAAYGSLVLARASRRIRHGPLRLEAPSTEDHTSVSAA